MNPRLFAVFDTETTGLTLHPQAPLKLQPRIIEFAGLLTDGYEVLDTLEFICDPGMEIEPIITEITGLTNADLRGKPKFETFIPALRAFFRQAEASVAHNHSFDLNLLTFDMQRAGRDIAELEMPKLQICTVEETMPRYGRNMKLSSLYNLFCGPYVQKHRALDDVKLLTELARTLGVFDAYTQEARGDN